MDRHGRRAIKISRHEQRFQKGRNLIVRLAKPGTEFRPQRGREVVTHEEAVNFSRNMLCSHGLRQDQIDNINAIEVALLAKKSLGGSVVLFRRYDEIEIDEIPPGKSSRRFTYIGFAVITDAHGNH